MATVDLDFELLAAELRAAGYDTVKHPEHYHGGTKLFSNKGIGSTLIVYPDGRCQAGQTMMTDDHWPALDIIRRHVSPEPSRRAAVDVDAVMKMVREYGNAMTESALADYLDSDKAAEDAALARMDTAFAAIRAMLEPHDAARLRETIAKALHESAATYPPAESVTCFNIDTAVDAVIRAIGGER